MDLTGKHVVVTGGGGGIGFGIVRQARLAGAEVTALDLSEEGRARVEALGADFALADVAEPDSFRDAVTEAAERHGGLQGMVNNAGLTIVRPFDEMTVELMDLLWRVNLRSVLIGSQIAAKLMGDGGGSIVNIASNHARASDAGVETYAATKGGIVSMARAMAWSLGPRGIRVNSLCPGLTITERNRAMTEDPAHLARFKGWSADGRISQPDDIGAAAVFLLSDAASAITGTELLADRAMSSKLG